MIRSTGPRFRSRRSAVGTALVALALSALLPHPARAAERDAQGDGDPGGTPGAGDQRNSPLAADSTPRREVVFAIGYGLLVAPQKFPVYGLKDRVDPTTTLDGITIDVTRRSSFLEYGARFFTTGGTSDHAGTPAHIVTQALAQIRIFPWSLNVIDPWAGATLGVALADDFDYWDKTDMERAHAVIGDMRAGLSTGLEAGVRCRFGRLLAMNARGGAGWLGFSPHPAIVREIDAPKYTLRPTDYGRRAWLSFGIALELTVPN